MGFLLVLFLLSAGTGAVAAGKADVVLSKHNLSATGPGPVTSRKQDACIFCHTPHDSEPGAVALWNRQPTNRTYNTYAVSTFSGGAATPEAGVSKFCLSCHDGTIALGQTVSEGLIATIGSMGPRAVVGDSGGLTNDHPLGVQPTDDSQLVLTLFDTPPTSGDPTVKLPNSRIEYTSCHDPHKEDLDTVAKKFLVRSNNAGALCLACHSPGRAQTNVLNGWTMSAHATATNTVPTTESFGQYGSVDTNACANCHKLHGTGTAPAAQLLRAAEESSCAPCHSGSNVSPALPNVMGEFAKIYAHPTTTLSGQHDPTENAFPLNANRHAECADCHNPHTASATGGATSPPGVGAPLLGASGYNGTAAVRPAANEYEVCFKCHADSRNKPQSSPGYTAYGYSPLRHAERNAMDPKNLREKFASTISRHNVTQPRRLSAAEVPSLRSFVLYANGAQGHSLALGTYTHCTDCHANNDAARSGGSGANGPHGSVYPHILTARYEQEVPSPMAGRDEGPGVPYVPGQAGSAALCNQCHDLENSVLQDRSFSQHRRHIVQGRTSCATCHEPHGIQDAGGNMTNNRALVSFDLTIVGPDSSNRLDFDSINRECYLTCHGVEHAPKRY